MTKITKYSILIFNKDVLLDFSTITNEDKKMLRNGKLENDIVIFYQPDSEEPYEAPAYVTEIKEDVITVKTIDGKLDTILKANVDVFKTIRQATNDEADQFRAELSKPSSGKEQYCLGVRKIRP